MVFFFGTQNDKRFLFCFLHTMANLIYFCDRLKKVITGLKQLEDE